MEIIEQDYILQTILLDFEYENFGRSGVCDLNHWQTFICHMVSDEIGGRIELWLTAPLDFDSEPRKIKSVETNLPTLALTVRHHGKNIFIPLKLSAGAILIRHDRENFSLSKS